MSVLLVDGDNLLTIGFFGIKNYFYKGKHFGGIYHFINTLRRSFDTYNLNKIVVFWDGENGSETRRKIYHLYKENRRNRIKNEEEIDSYNYQRTRVKQYLEELYVRQGEYEFCETDDCIAYYTQNSPNEDKIIFSSDGDLTQLISESTKIYNPSHTKLYGKNDTYIFNNENILIENIKIIKILCGDSSDNISGIKSLGIKRLLSFFPELRDKQLSLEDIQNKANELLKNDKHNTTIKNLLSGVTKEGVFGEEFFYINKKIISLDEPLITEEAKTNINQLINENLDSEGRSYKNSIKLMLEDGIHTVLPKTDEAMSNFLNPFLRLTIKEKNKRVIKLN